MAGKAGQIIPRGERTCLVRVFMGRDSESGKRKYVNMARCGTRKRTATEASAIATSVSSSNHLG
jgi:hypothetical protein